MLVSIFKRYEKIPKIFFTFYFEIEMFSLPLQYHNFLIFQSLYRNLDVSCACGNLTRSAAVLKNRLISESRLTFGARARTPRASSGDNICKTWPRRKAKAWCFTTHSAATPRKIWNSPFWSRSILICRPKKLPLRNNSRYFGRDFSVVPSHLSKWFHFTKENRETELRAPGKFSEFTC